MLRLDYSASVLILVLAFVAGWTWWKSGFSRAIRSPAVLGLAASVAVPLAMGLAGRYPIYYTWMTYLPLAVFAAMAINAQPAGAAAGVRRGNLGVCPRRQRHRLAIAVGLTALEWRYTITAPSKRSFRDMLPLTMWLTVLPGVLPRQTRAAQRMYVGHGIDAMTPQSATP